MTNTNKRNVYKDLDAAIQDALADKDITFVGNYCNRDPLIYLQIGKTRILAVVDSGCSCVIIDQSVYENVKLKYPTLIGPEINAGGQITITQGDGITNVQVTKIAFFVFTFPDGTDNKKVYRTYAYVSPNLSDDVLFGCSVLYDFLSVIDFNFKELECRDPITDEIFLIPFARYERKIRSSDDSTVEPMEPHKPCDLNVKLDLKLPKLEKGNQQTKEVFSLLQKHINEQAVHGKHGKHRVSLFPKYVQKSYEWPTFQAAVDAWEEHFSRFKALAHTESKYQPSTGNHVHYPMAIDFKDQFTTNFLWGFHSAVNGVRTFLIYDGRLQRSVVSRSIANRGNSKMKYRGFDPVHNIDRNITHTIIIPWLPGSAFRQCDHFQVAKFALQNSNHDFITREFDFEIAVDESISKGIVILGRDFAERFVSHIDEQLLILFIRNSDYPTPIPMMCNRKIPMMKIEKIYDQLRNNPENSPI